MQKTKKIRIANSKTAQSKGCDPQLGDQIFQVLFISTKEASHFPQITSLT